MTKYTLTKTQVINRKDKKVVRIEFEITEMDRWDKNQNKACLLERLTDNAWMLEHYADWAGWDWSFSVKLFSDALKHTGLSIIKYGNAVNSVKCGRRALCAAGMLTAAYNDSKHEDKSFNNWHDRRYVVFKPHKLGKLMCTEYRGNNAMGLDEKEYSEKMYNIISKRTDASQADKKRAAWEYIHKYIEHWWD